MKIIVCDRIITGDGETVLTDKAVCINGNSIEKIGTLEELKTAYPDSELEMKPGCTLIPGLIDTHVHISTLGGAPMRAQMEENAAYIMVMVYKNLQNALSVGITTMRGMGEAKGIGEAVRGGYHYGFIKGPRYLTCERRILRTGAHRSTGECAKLEADGPWGLRVAVRQVIQDGADWIKIMTSHRGHCSDYTLEELCAVTDEAHRLGYKCCVHAGTEQAISYCVEAGFDSIEHGAFFPEELCEKAIEKGLAWVPTISAYEHAFVYMNNKIKNPTKRDKVSLQFLADTVDAYNEHFLRNYKMGILVSTGTDNTFWDDFRTPIQKEIKALANHGLTNLQAIQCATANGAKMLDLDDEIGMVKEGLRADLVVVKGDPSTNIDDLNNVLETYRDGELLYKK